MRYLILLNLLLSCSVVHAVRFDKLPANAEYMTFVNKPTAEMQTALLGLDAFFNTRAYQGATFDGNPALLSLNWLDRLYVNKNLSKAIMVKSGLEYSHRLIKPGVIYKEKSGLLVHLKIPAGNIAIHFLYKHEQNEVATILQELQKRKTALGWPTLPKLKFIAEASAREASTPACYGERDFKVQENNANSKEAGAVALAVLKTGGSCLKGIAMGVWDATGGLVVSGAKGIGYVITHSPSEVWGDLTAQFEGLKGFFSNFTNNLGEFKNAFLALPAPAMAAVVCEIGSAIATGILLPGYIATKFNLLDKVKAALTSATTLKAAGSAASKAKQLATQIEVAQSTKTPAQIGAMLYEQNQKIQTLEKQVQEALKKKLELEQKMRAAGEESARLANAKPTAESITLLAKSAHAGQPENFARILEELIRLERSYKLTEEQKSLVALIRKRTQDGKALYENKIRAAQQHSNSDFAEGDLNEALDVADNALKTTVSPQLELLARDMARNPPAEIVRATDTQVDAIADWAKAKTEWQNLSRELSAARRSRDEASEYAATELRNMGAVSTNTTAQAAAQSATDSSRAEAASLIAYRASVACQTSASTTRQVPAQRRGSSPSDK